MGYQNVLLEVADGIATVTLNRPEKLNAYTTEMGDEVVDSSVVVVVLDELGIESSLLAQPARVNRPAAASEVRIRCFMCLE